MKQTNRRRVTPQVYDNPTMDRRGLFRRFGGGVVLWSLVVGSKAVAAEKGRNLSATPKQAEGPFYPVQRQRDKDLDLTYIEGSSKRAEGEPVIIAGRVMDVRGAPLQGVLVDIWQANARGRYRHPKDPNPAPLDPYFQGWGQVYTNDLGEYHFRTIVPGAYPAGPGWNRPPHIHFKLVKQGYQSLTTQMYFPEQPLNDADLILQQFSTTEQALLIAGRAKPKTGESAETQEEVRFEFDLVLA